MCMVDLFYLARTVSVNYDRCLLTGAKVRVLYRCNTCLITSNILTLVLLQEKRKGFDDL